MKTFTDKDIMKTAEHIRDFTLECMASAKVKKDWDLLNRIRFSSMSEIDGLQKLLVIGEWDHSSPLNIGLQQIWKLLLDA